MKPHKAAVLGSPIAHSRSPQLHMAAYKALGLHDWTYDRIECTAEQLPSLVKSFDSQWAGVSVTMPAKFAALAFADERTARAELVGSANTLVRTDRGWRADNTDIDGVIGALGELFQPSQLGQAVVLGSGGTAPAAVAGLCDRGVTGITVIARNEHKAATVVELGTRLGVSTRFCAVMDAEVADVIAQADVLISTIPADAASQYGAVLSGAAVLFDVIYDPWPTPLASAVAGAGGRVMNGLPMLLYQAISQVEQFTGLSAPRAPMAAVVS